MKKLSLLVICLSGFVLLGLATPAFAEDEPAKEKTITGDGKCAKCALHETEKCQNAIETENAEGKKVVYYLADNQVAKDFHPTICKETKKVTATGTVKKVDGKMEMTATKIEEAK
jgi:hypothetical protein